MSYTLTTTVRRSFAETLDATRVSLTDQGFGVLTEIDVQATLRDKLGEQIEEYLILGACNPPLAHRALTADRRIGLLLPCNVVVRALDDGRTLVQTLDPQVMVSVTGNPALAEVADDAAARLREVLATLGGSAT